MANVEEVDDAKKKGRMVLICVIAAVAMAGAIWSGFRSLDNRPRVTGILGNGGDPQGTTAPSNSVAPGKSGQ